LKCEIILRFFTVALELGTQCCLRQKPSKAQAMIMCMPTLNKTLEQNHIVHQALFVLIYKVKYSMLPHAPVVSRPS
jgi:hypothetical protein